MNINLATQVFDISGFVEIQSVITQDNGAVRRRANKVQTLDGGVAVNDRGFSYGDRELEITFQTVSKDHTDKLSRMVKLYDIVNASFDEGCFEAIPLAFTAGPTESQLTVSLTAKISS